MSASACPGGAPSQESGPVQHAASAITAPDTDQLPVYWQFHEAVTRAQLTEWLPTGRHLLVDVSGPRAPGAELAAKAGHTVLRVLGGARQGRPAESAGPGRIIQVIADSSRLTFLGDECADGVIADDRALSVHLAAEAMIAEIARVLRPAGRAGGRWGARSAQTRKRGGVGGGRPPGLTPSLGPLGLAADAAGRVGAGVEPALGYLVAAVHALPVAVPVDAAQRGEHPVTLGAGGVEDRLGAGGLRAH